ncbi:membrane protein [Streptomyces sp. MUSC 125]|uniref:ABC transporter ATP-binding protein n=1 Tax=Streptomyces sp. MUSC 125 TaxID=1428624 RepID=UPI00058077E7|nr:ABC transporter ATP-binding protein [Streptomyces sp. MUSC 125]KIE22787.1 membrane protein [Streptomyces sp. MUSC 125]
MAPIPLEARAVRKSFALHGRQVQSLKDTDLQLPSGQITALVGRSGSGKTTLLQIMGLLLQPDEGVVLIDGQDAWALGENQRADLRRSKLGFVFQAFNLLPQHSALRNVALAYHGNARVGAQKATGLLEHVGLANRIDHRPSQLSAGEQQRVALARALVNEPGTVLADEPTGNLDAANEHELLRLFRQIADDGRAVLLVTHSETVAAHADQVLRMSDGVAGPADAVPEAHPESQQETRP